MTHGCVLRLVTCDCWWQQASPKQQHQWASLRKRPSVVGGGTNSAQGGAHGGASGSGSASGSGAPREARRVLLAVTATMPVSETGCKVHSPTCEPLCLVSWDFATRDSWHVACDMLLVYRDECLYHFALVLCAPCLILLLSSLWVAPGSTWLAVPCPLGP